MWDFQNLIDALRYPSVLGALTALLLNKKNTKKQTKICQHKKKNHKSIPRSLSIAATVLVLFAQHAKLGGQAT